MITIFPRSRISFLFNWFSHHHSFFSVLSQNFQAWFYLFEYVKHSFHHLSLIIPLSVVLCICFCCLLFLCVFNSYCLISLWDWLSLIMWWTLDLKAIYRSIFKPIIMLFFSKCLLLPDAWGLTLYHHLNPVFIVWDSVVGGLWDVLMLDSSSHGGWLTSWLFYSEGKSS